jgi:hypothetical protein
MNRQRIADPVFNQALFYKSARVARSVPFHPRCSGQRSLDAGTDKKVDATK